MVPSTGWLNPVDNSNAAPEAWPLPQVHSARYSDANPVVSFVSNPPIVVVSAGNTLVIPQLGFDVNNEEAVQLDLNQFEVFAVVLLDKVTLSLLVVPHPVIRYSPRVARFPKDAHWQR